MEVAMRVPLASTGLRQQDIDSAVAVLNSGNLTMGAKVKEFESEMARYLRVKHFVMMNSGSSANLAMIEALIRPTNNSPKLSIGDGVLVPAIAWPTTIWPLIQLGLRPEFVDISIENLAIDLEKAQLLIDKSKGSIKGIFPIHPLGKALDGEKLTEFAKRNNLVLIHDVCESLGSWNNDIHTGTQGEAASFSFYFSHHMTTMEGGGVATNNSEIADDLRSIRSHGWSRDRSDSLEWSKEKSSNDAKFLFVSTGYNIRPMEIQAAIGLSQLPDLDGFVTKRREIARHVNQVLKNSQLHLVGGETFDDANREKTHSWMHLPILVKDDPTGAKKHEIVDHLEEAGIETRPVLTGNFLSQPSIRRITPELPTPDAFPVATLVTDSGFLIGCHHDLNKEHSDYLCSELSKWSK